jgi:hypothetical protein
MKFPTVIRTVFSIAFVLHLIYCSYILWGIKDIDTKKQYYSILVLIGCGLSYLEARLNENN